MGAWVLWGFHPVHQREPIKLTGGTLGHCQREGQIRVGLGWTVASHLEGTPPVGLREQAREAFGDGKGQ